jgi:hypothetical protein
MKVHEVSENEWKEMSEKKRIKVLMAQGMSYREAWELSESKRVSDLPGQLLPLRISV